MTDIKCSGSTSVPSMSLDNFGVVCKVFMEALRVSESIGWQCFAVLTDEGMAIVGPLDQVIGSFVADHATIVCKWGFFLQRLKKCGKGK